MTTSNNEAAAARENARRDNGQFGEQPKQDPGSDAIPAATVTEVPLSDVRPGDIIWADGNPVEVVSVHQRYYFRYEVVDTDGRLHNFDHPTDAAQATVMRAASGLAPFEPIDWIEAPDFDDWESEQKQVDACVRYNADGYGQVSATLTGVGDYRFHAAYYLDILGDFDDKELLPDGRTKGEAFDAWIEDLVMNAVDDGIRDRYDWDVMSSDTADSDVRPLLVATNTVPGEIDAETAAKLLWPAQARFINESDPGTNSGRGDYPYHDWIDAAVKARQAAGEKGLPW